MMYNVIIKNIYPKQEGGCIMPRQNGMGPTGAGPMTGRGMGLCTKSSNLSGTRLGLGLGRRQGRGLGIRRGAGRCYYG
ncbi:DUF5320 domain-containing protein, partial [Methanosarcina mazei]|uniref:DUF5320 domain-containing protein n=1 Tax=Methanosarcina mazei TaxID=2209 RepID=UPI001910BEF1